MRAGSQLRRSHIFAFPKPFSRLRHAFVTPSDRLRGGSCKSLRARYLLSDFPLAFATLGWSYVELISRLPRTCWLPLCNRAVADRESGANLDAAWRPYRALFGCYRPSCSFLRPGFESTLIFDNADLASGCLLMPCDCVSLSLPQNVGHHVDVWRKLCMDLSAFLRQLRPFPSGFCATVWTVRHGVTVPAFLLERGCSALAQALICDSVPTVLLRVFELVSKRRAVVHRVTALTVGSLEGRTAMCSGTDKLCQPVVILERFYLRVRNDREEIHHATQPRSNTI